jgi:hypothetical protein
VERVVSPLPDYRTIMGQGPTRLPELFDLLFVATSDVTDPTRTFLAAHHARDRAELESSLGSEVVWAGAHGGRLGTRPPSRDPRLFLAPDAHWTVLARPELLGDLATPGAATADGPPPWLRQLEALRATDGDVLGWLALGALEGEVGLPGDIRVPAPRRTLITALLTADGGIRLVGRLSFAREADATAFAAGLLRARDAALGSRLERLVLSRLHAEGVLATLTAIPRGKEVVLDARSSETDALGMLKSAASGVASYVETHQK